MIDKTKQLEILTTIRALATSDSEMDYDRARLILIGVLVALGTSGIPPFWYINIQARAVDRLFTQDYLKSLQ